MSAAAATKWPGTSPSQYVMKVDRATGRELPGPIPPEELLVHAHRDHHPLDVAVQLIASRLVELTSREWVARDCVRGLRWLGDHVAAAVGAVTGNPGLERRSREILGVVKRDCLFHFREPASLSADELQTRVAALRQEAGAALGSARRGSSLRVLLTGATGFLGKEILVQAVASPRVAEVVCLLRPERVPQGRREGPHEVLHAEERGARLLQRLGIRGAGARRIRFVDGDVERPGLGLHGLERERLRRTLTHVVHCAASVSFDEAYESSFRANVGGSRNALALSLDLQRARGSPFVLHVAVETSYIHGRPRQGLAREGRLVFPPHYYNNFYELTKAMAAIETDRALLEDGLRVVQLLPSIVIGDARTGNNRGDTKVVNAPVNAFGRVKQALEAVSPSHWREHLRGYVVGVLGASFPADPSAELNLVTVDRVAAGVLAALTAPEAVGARIHLANDQRIRSEQLARVIREELEIDVRMADPTLTRVLALPLAKALLHALGEEKLARSFERLGGIFGTYSEWGQPIHDVGDDVKVLALPARRPDAVRAFRMLCRHNRFVQGFGTVRDPHEVARRERLWEHAIDDIEYGTSRPASSLPAPEFRRLLEERIDLVGFKRRGVW
jgi:nucleoside-diphosphate-sugar epimerase